MFFNLHWRGAFSHGTSRLSLRLIAILLSSLLSNHVSVSVRRCILVYPLFVICTRTRLSYTWTHFHTVTARTRLIPILVVTIIPWYVSACRVSGTAAALAQASDRH